MMRHLIAFALFFIHLCFAEGITLHEAEELAIEHNPQLRSVSHLLKKARYARFEALTAFFPSGSFSGSVRRVDQGGSLGFSTLYNSTFDFRETLWESKAWHEIFSSRIRYKSELAEYQIQYLQLLFEVREAFYEAVLGREQIAVERENIERLQDALKREEARRDAGESTSFDVNQSRVAVANALSELYTAEREKKVSEHRLRKLLGLEASEDLWPLAETIPVLAVPDLADKIQSLNLNLWDLQADLRLAVFTVAEMEQWEALALSCSPDIEKARLAARLAHSQLRGEQGTYFPRIELFAQLNNKNSSGISFLSRNSYWDMGARFEWSLFDGLGRESRVKQGIRERYSKRALYEDRVLAVQQELKDRFAEIEEALLSYFSARESMHLAKEAVLLAEERRSSGFITALEYRDSSSQLKESKQDFNIASFRLLKAYFALRQTAASDL